MISLDRNRLIACLNATEIPWRFGLSECHYNIVPVHNFQKWTPEQELALAHAIDGIELGVTRRLVQRSRHGFDTFLAKPGKGMRAFSAPWAGSPIEFTFHGGQSVVLIDHANIERARIRRIDFGLWADVAYYLRATGQASETFIHMSRVQPLEMPVALAV